LHFKENIYNRADQTVAGAIFWLSRLSFGVTDFA